MFRFFSLLTLTFFLCNCGGNAQESSPASASSPASTSDLQLNEKGRIPYSAVLTVADGPFAGTYQLDTKKSKGSIIISPPNAERLEKYPYLENTFDLVGISLITEDESFGIANISRRFAGGAEIGSHASVDNKGKCGNIQLEVPTPEGVIRHVYVKFLDCSGMDITGFGDEWKESKYSPKRSRPVAAKFTERVEIEDINSTEDTREKHETTMTLEFVGGHSVDK